MKTIKLDFLFLVMLTMFLMSCGKNDLQGSFLLTEKMKNQNPYSIGNRLFFVNDNMDTLDFLVTLKNNQIYERLLSVNSNSYYLIENEDTSIDSAYFGGFWMSMTGVINSSPIYTLYFNYDNRGMTASFDLPLSTENTKYIDSLLIMGNWGKNIFYFEKEKMEDYAYKLYYSTNNGIVRIDFSDGGFWELESIEW